MKNFSVAIKYQILQINETKLENGRRLSYYKHIMSPDATGKIHVKLLNTGPPRDPYSVFGQILVRTLTGYCSVATWRISFEY